MALISTDPTLVAELAEALSGSSWSIEHIEATPIGANGAKFDVVALDARDVGNGSADLPTGWPVLLVHGPGTSTPEADSLADDLVFRGAGLTEWIARLERLRTRTPLETLRRQYEEAFASMAPGIMVIDADHNLVFANPRAYEIVGHREETVDEHAFRSLVTAQDWPRIEHALSEREYPHGIDLGMVRREGREIVCSVSLTPLLGAEDHTVVSFEDVTAERQTEQELFKTMQFLESLIDASVDAIIATDMEQRIVLFNPSAERVTGQHVADAMGALTLSDLLGRASAELVMQRLAIENYGGEGRLEPTLLELVNVHKQSIPVQLSASMIYEDREPTAIVLIFTDLRERVRVEERLAQAQKKLAFSEKQGVLAELAGTAAHELNQPLTSMMAYAELLARQSERGSTGAKAAEVLIREAERMAEIVRKIGRITKYETTSYVGQQKIFDLDRAADSTTSDPGSKG
ncbi:MAG: PAS domain S-box protein [Polyangiales bacterium]